MTGIRFPYGNSSIEMRFPDNLDFRILIPNKADPVRDPVEEIKRALREPIGSLALAELSARGKSAAVIVSDQTRLAPTPLFLPYIIDEVVAGGISRNNTTVVVAVGAHRKASEEEIKTIVGMDVYRSVKCCSSSCASRDCIDYGQTSRGTPVRIFRGVAECDLIVATGNIEPHRMASFSGGAKALVPGCSSLETIVKNHSLSITVEDCGSCANPVREDAEEAAAMSGLDFIFNVVVDKFGRLIKAYAGDPVKAHREGCRLAGKVYYVNTGSRADIVVASAGGYPKDANLYQAVKALQNAADVVKDGGIVVLAASCREGFGNEVFRDWAESGFTGNKAIERFSRGFVLGGHKAAYAAEVTEKCRVCFVSELPAGIPELLGFVCHTSMEEAFLHALKKSCPDPDITVMPYAGLTFRAPGNIECFKEKE